MFIKIILFIFTIFLIGCGGSQEPPIKPFSINSLSLVSDLSGRIDEDENISFSTKSFSFSHDFDFLVIKSLPQNGKLYLNNTLLSSDYNISKDNLDHLVYKPNSNFHGKDSFLFKVKIGSELSKNFEYTIFVKSINDAPIFTTPNNISVKENQKTALTLTANDPDGDRLIYTISGKESSFFDINSSSGEVKFKIAPDYESKKSYEFIASVSDGNLTTTQNMKINIININDNTPVFDLKVYNKSFESSSISNDLNSTSTIISIDFNHDGKVDILTSDIKTNRVIWFENRGDLNFREHNITSSLKDAYFVKAVDLDKDGDLDIVAGGSEELVWYKNDNLTFTKIVIDSSESYKADIKDIDKDGDLDIVSIVSVDYDNKVNLYKNQNQNFTKSVLDQNIDTPTDVKVYDIDSDGDLDIIVSAYYDGVVQYKQNSSGSFDKSSIYSSDDFLGTNYLEVKDGEIYSTNFIDNALIKDDAKLITLLQPTSVKVWDVDSDGDDDIVTTSFSNSYLTWFERIDNNDYLTHKIASYGYGVDIGLGDIDGDGDVDIVTALKDDKKLLFFDIKDSIYVDENNKSVTVISASDVDGDSLNYSLSGEDSNLFNIDNNGTLTFKQAPDFENPQDSNKNNKYNITVNVSDTNTTISKDIRVVVRNLSFFKKKEIDNSLVDLVDMEFKEDDLLVIDDEEDGTKVYRYKILDNFNKTQELFTNNYYAYDLLVFDNRVFISYDSNDISEYDSSWQESVVDDNCPSAYKLISADIDSDGKNDLVATCEDSVKWYKNEDNGSLNEKDISVGFVNGSYPFDLAAVGNTHKDLLVSVPNDYKVYKLKNDSNENFTKEIFLDEKATKLFQDENTTFAIIPEQNRAIKVENGEITTINNPNSIVYPNSIIVEDINGNGLKDIIITTKDDMKLIWYKAKQDGEYEEHIVSYFDKEPRKVLLKDIDGDGKKDMIVGTMDKLFVFYQKSEEKNLINF